MAQILVRNLDDSVVRRLKEQAKQHGRSLQAEVKMILDGTGEKPKLDHAAALALCDEIRSQFKGRKFPDSVELIREDRDR